MAVSRGRRITSSKNPGLNPAMAHCAQNYKGHIDFPGKKDLGRLTTGAQNYRIAVPAGERIEILELSILTNAVTQYTSSHDFKITMGYVNKQLLTATTAAGSAVVTVADTSLCLVGQAVQIIADGVTKESKTIASVDSATQITLNSVATGTFTVALNAFISITDADYFLSSYTLLDTEIVQGKEKQLSGSFNAVPKSIPGPATILVDVAIDTGGPSIDAVVFIDLKQDWWNEE